MHNPFHFLSFICSEFDQSVRFKSKEGYPVRCTEGCSCDDDDCLNVKWLHACRRNCSDSCQNQEANRVPLSRDSVSLSLHPEKGVMALARKDFTSGSFIMEFVGVMMSEHVLQDRQEMGKTSTYTLQCAMSPEKWTKKQRNGEEGYVIDPKNAGNLAGFLNHSCRPNALFVFVSIGSFLLFQANYSLNHNSNLRKDIAACLFRR